MENSRFKFRVWDEGIFNDSKSKYIYADVFTGLVLKLASGNNPIEQCTGLKDKNGRLIYEGDIVKEIILDEDSALGREFEEKSVICFGGGDYPCSFTMKSKRFYNGFALLGYGINRIEIEIIGNIHENGDLL